MRLTEKQRAAMKGTRMRELRALGYKSDIFPAKFRGGTCGLSGLPIHVGDEVAYFRDKGLCHSVPISNFLHAEKLAAAPKCSCGLRAEYDDSCLRCGFVCEEYFDERPRDVTRETMPVRTGS